MLLLRSPSRLFLSFSIPLHLSLQLHLRAGLSASTHHHSVPALEICTTFATGTSFFAELWSPWYLHGSCYNGPLVACLSLHAPTPRTENSLALAALPASSCLRAWNHRETLLLSSHAFALAASPHQRSTFSRPCRCPSPHIAPSPFPAPRTASRSLKPYALGPLLRRFLPRAFSTASPFCSLIQWPSPFVHTHRQRPRSPA